MWWQVGERKDWCEWQEAGNTGRPDAHRRYFNCRGAKEVFFKSNFSEYFRPFEEKRKAMCTVYLFTESFLAEEDRIFPSGDSKKAKYQENPANFGEKADK